MFNSKLPEKVIKLLSSIDSCIPADRREIKEIKNAAKELAVENEFLKSVFEDLKTSLGQRELYIKYIFFDLEATRRERDCALEKVRELEEDNSILEKEVYELKRRLENGF